MSARTAAVADNATAAVDVDSLCTAAARAYATAREHKRESARHRRAAAAEMERFEALRRRLRTFGVDLQITQCGANEHGTKDPAGAAG